MKLFSKRLITHKEPISKFRDGIVVKMEIGSRSHVEKPYYVEVTYFNKSATEGETIMITRVPQWHELRMIVGSNWEYHYPRMEIMGPVAEFGHLVSKQ